MMRSAKRETLWTALLEQLPERVERNKHELRELVSSVQFKQAVRSLEYGLRLDFSAANSVEAFLRAIQKQTEHERERGGTKDDKDSMETD
ncbi:hypothetical protein EV182_001979 [Spiromyces aspiralis]|uniref:Uncharacterized protein n=1 Tax=Spiromyces aspiralis TaxID=68401 RepID=A0ACC1HFW2_9FUNG|nr:hypothetical protein EV182_001979 [Spiromyces aspiralis]